LFWNLVYCAVLLFVPISTVCDARWATGAINPKGSSGAACYF
jgi:hypothetical protein